MAEPLQSQPFGFEPVIKLLQCHQRKKKGRNKLISVSRMDITFFKMKKEKQTHFMERRGVSKVSEICSKYEWIFREQTIGDKGIDAQIEIFDESDQKSPYKLIALQIKSGKSFFKNKSDTYITYKTDRKHIDYWIKYPIPVIIVLFNPDEERLYWQVISEENYEKTGEDSFKIKIPRSNFFGETPPSLKNLWQPTPYEIRLERLKFSKNWMNSLKNGGKITLKATESKNKSLGRVSSRLIIERRPGEKEEYPFSMYGGGLTIDSFMEEVFPWANAQGDEEAYKEYLRDFWAADHVHTGREGEYFESQSFDSWYKSRLKQKFFPLDDGEYKFYKLKLSLNAFGRAFLKIDTYLSR